MASTERFQAIIEVNNRKAMGAVEELRKEQKAATEELIRLKQKDSGATKEQIRAAELKVKTVTKALKTEEKHVKGLSAAMESLSKKNYKELQSEVKALSRMMRDGSVSKNSEEWQALANRIKNARKEMREYEIATKETQSFGTRFFKFLNDSWGGLLIAFQTITGVSQTIRKSVQDYADMEEKMADVRKYTGMTDEAVRDLNEDLKKMDTRTSRQELNELAGVAGRLGITVKEQIKEFVDGANQIKVALGDDLGDQAIDQVGKLAMAFGEDKEKGLRGAMLATGSALNELSQNSSAQAGYLVDFTARVAGFGKQLGLTQAQIMGFGAVMDENLLRDEMSATAFGNMLTKMQTDTEKFAKIAGKDVKDFAKLLKDDANAAILAVADSLKRADPQTMMKMLDDMGLDGSRAVGVLSTLADKIDDVRERQALATKAYNEATSVTDEYNRMNNTVQAGIEKAKKEFMEMSVELGQRLLPVVKYTISGGAQLAKILNITTKFVVENRTAIIALTAAIVVNTAVYRANTIAKAASNTIDKIGNALLATKQALLGTLKNAYLAWNIVIAAVSGNHARLNWLMIESNKIMARNVWGALLTVILAVTVAVVAAVKAWRSHNKAVLESMQAVKNLRAQQKAQKEMSEQVAQKTAEERTKIEQLNKIIHSNSFTVRERQNAIAAMQKIVPNYHASISKEGKLYNENSNAIRQYIVDLNTAALAEAAYAKKVEINKKRLELEGKKGRIEFSLKSVYAEREAHPERYQNTVGWNTDGRGGIYTYEKESDAMRSSRKQEEIHTQRLNDTNSEIAALNAEEKYIDKLIEKDKKLNEHYQKQITAGTNTNNTTTLSGGGGSGYTSTSDEKAAARAAKAKDAADRKAEAARKREEAKIEKERKERADAAKADYKSDLAAAMLSYSQGLTNYTDYMKKRHEVAQKYYDKMKAIYGEDSTEYKNLLEERQKADDKYQDTIRKSADEDYLRERAEKEHKIRMMFAQRGVVDESQLNEALFINDIEYLEKKKDLYKSGTKERIDIEDEIAQRGREHQWEKEMEWNERLSQYREEMGSYDFSKMQAIEEEGVRRFYSVLVREGKMTQDEYNAILEHIRKRYAELAAEQTASNSTKAKAGASLQKASAAVDAKNDFQDNAGDNAATGVNFIIQTVERQRLVNEELKKLYDKDYENNAEYQEAKRQLNQETLESIVAGAQTAYSSINSLMSAASAYSQACSDLEVAKISANYDKQIEAAGKNNKKREKLEKKKQEAIAKVKNRANKKAMKIEIAQAVASTALAAINSYASAAKVNWILGAIAASLATAAGMIQIATIKKQHAIEATGYYGGGFTGGKRYKKEAGVVHEGEFVANHQAVNNPNLAPVLNMIDEAQRNNRVASLTAADVSRSVGGGAAAVVAPQVNINTDNSELRGTMEGVNRTLDKLYVRLDDPMLAVFSTEQADKELKKWNRMKNNV